MTRTEYYHYFGRQLKIETSDDGARRALVLDRHTGQFVEAERGIVAEARSKMTSADIWRMDLEEFIFETEDSRATYASGDGPVFTLYRIIKGIQEVAESEGRPITVEELETILENLPSNIRAVGGRRSLVMMRWAGLLREASVPQSWRRPSEDTQGALPRTRIICCTWLQRRHRRACFAFQGREPVAILGPPPLRSGARRPQLRQPVRPADRHLALRPIPLSRPDPHERGRNQLPGIVRSRRERQGVLQYRTLRRRR